MVLASVHRTLITVLFYYVSLNYGPHQSLGVICPDSVRCFKIYNHYPVVLFGNSIIVKQPLRGAIPGADR